MIVYLVQVWRYGCDYFDDGKESDYEFVIDSKEKIVEKLKTYNYWSIAFANPYNVTNGDYVADGFTAYECDDKDNILERDFDELWSEYH